MERNFSEILIEIYTFSFKKMHLKMSFWKWRPCCLGLNVLIQEVLDLYLSLVKNIELFTSYLNRDFCRNRLRLFIKLSVCVKLCFPGTNAVPDRTLAFDFGNINKATTHDHCLSGSRHRSPDSWRQFDDNERDWFMGKHTDSKRIWRKTGSWITPDSLIFCVLAHYCDVTISAMAS